MVPTDGVELKRRKKVNVDEIAIVKTLDSDFQPLPLVLYGTQIESDICIQWETCDVITPINSCITNHCIQIEPAAPLDWSFDTYLIEVNDVRTDVMYGNVDLNGTVLKVKQDTGAQINVLSKVVFQTLQKESKLPLYPKTCTKFIGYGNKVINYLGTTKIKCIQYTFETEAIFYVTNVQDSKIILGL